MNILEPSLSFFDESGDPIAKWAFDKEYTGALLIQHDRVLLYGHKLAVADIYELSTGKLLTSIQTGLGSTNAYYDSEYQRIFITNSETNSVLSYDQQGNKIGETPIGNYPMSMASNDGLLYVINYKDTKLSVVNIETMKLETEWTIEESSNGILILPEKNTVWIGGHGEGNKTNQTVDLFDLKSGKLLNQVEVSIMPVGFTRNNQEVYIINHGANELYVTDLDGNTLWYKEIGANPFSVASFLDYIVVAGFDDHKLYFLKDEVIEKTIDTGNGPFQLIVREG